MKKSFILPRISALSIALLSVATTKGYTLWICIVAIVTLIYIINAAVSAHKGGTSFLKALFPYKINFIDLIIAGVGFGLALAWGEYRAACIWVISLGCIWMVYMLLSEQ